MSFEMWDSIKLTASKQTAERCGWPSAIPQQDALTKEKTVDNRSTNRSKKKRSPILAMPLLMALLTASTAKSYAEQPPLPCHPNPTAAADDAALRARGDIASLPGPLKDRLAQLANRPHTIVPLQVFNEADGASQLFQYYLLDTSGFQPNVFTTIFPGINDHVQLTVTGANCGLSTIGAVRVVLEPKPGLPTDPNNPRAFIDVFTDIDPMFVINNESGWYEGWMIHRRDRLLEGLNCRTLVCTVCKLIHQLV